MKTQSQKRLFAFWNLDEEDESSVQLAWGTSLIAAIEGHYDEMDMYCIPPADLEDVEFQVSVFEVPEHLEGHIQELYDNKEEAADEISKIAELLENPTLTVNVTIGAKGNKVSM